MVEIDSEKGAQSVTLVGAAVNTILIGLKFSMGLLGNSQALIADAFHSISDLSTDIVVLFGIWRGRKPPDEKHPFGHGRIETLSTAFVGIALIITALYLGIHSAMDIYFHKEYHPTLLAILGASISIAAKETLYHFTIHAGKRIKSPLIIANAWHHRSDALSSIAVLLGVAIAHIKPEWNILDAYAALLVSFLIIKVGMEISAKAFHELSDAAPAPEIIQQIKKCSLGVAGVMGVHDLRVRTSAEKIQLEIHIVINGRQTVVEGHHIAKNVERCLLEDIDRLSSVIIHMDPTEDEPISS